MNHHPDDDLRRLLHDAVDGVEPRPGLTTIRSRTSRSKEDTMSRNWLFGALGAAVATAAVIVVTTVVGSGGNDDPPATSPTQTPTTAPSSSPDPSPSTTTTSPAPDDVAVPVYYVGETARGLGLYREFQRASGADDPVLAAVTLAVAGNPLDPDYRSVWPDDAGVAGVEATPDLITVDLSGASAARPAGMSEREAALAIEQVVYTAQAAYGKGRLPVAIQLGNGPTAEVLGVPTSEPLANGPVLKTLSHVNLTNPAEGQTVSGDTLAVSGVANSFEANVVVRLQRFEGTEVMAQEPFTAEGWMGDQLFPFAGSIDISEVPPGRYTLTAMTDDPSGGAEGPGADSDSKVITIE